jgi:CheY-like chemotaxis protein
MHRIVVIEDEQIVARVISTVLIRAGYAVETAGSGLDGVTLVENLEPQLVLCDMRMPDISGFEVVHRLKKNPRTANIPVLILSAYSSESLAGLGNAQLQKPFAVPDLLKTVATLLASAK